MKTKLLVLNALGLGLLIGLNSFTASAQSVQANSVHNKVTIWMDSNPNGLQETVLWQCYALEDKATALLKKLSATNVKAYCSGFGAPDQVSLNPTLSLQFDSLKLASNNSVDAAAVNAQYVHVELKDFSDCETTHQIFDGVKKYFEVKDLVGENECYRNDEPYHYSFSVLAPVGTMD